MAEQKTQQKMNEDRIIRILSKDIEGKVRLYPGLTQIKGISWSLSNAICKKLKFDKNRKIASLSPEEIRKIEGFIKSPETPKFILNRRSDFETGEDTHLIGSDLDLKKEFDIKRLKKIKSYRGLRHNIGLPVRGQRTKAHFRRNRKKSGGIKKKVKK